MNYFYIEMSEPFIELVVVAADKNRGTELLNQHFEKTGKSEKITRPDFSSFTTESSTISPSCNKLFIFFWAGILNTRMVMEGFKSWKEAAAYLNEINGDHPEHTNPDNWTTVPVVEGVYVIWEVTE